MRAYVTVLNSDHALLPFFVRYYVRLGVKDFPVQIFDEPERYEQVHAHCRAVIEANGGRYLRIASFPFVDFSDKLREATIKEFHNGDWAFFTDLDEFPQVSLEALEAFKRNGKRFIWGTWLDRVGPGGQLVNVMPDKSLDEQFPMQTKRPMAQILKVEGTAFVFSKKAPDVHHPRMMQWCRRAMANGNARKIAVHHFKWQGNVIDRLTKRLVMIEKRTGQSQWLRNVKRVVSTVRGGIDPSILVPCKCLLGV